MNTIPASAFHKKKDIAAFTGGDVTCRTDFYEKCARLIKRRTQLWVLIETEGLRILDIDVSAMATHISSLMSRGFSEGDSSLI